jgi:hypothetical protein
MMSESHNKFGSCRGRSGVVLLVTLVLLVVLSILGYTVSTQVAARRHRSHYVMNYQIARYACDSAVKYALAAAEELSPQLISRPNEPDFSDLFYLDEEQYQELLAQWAEHRAFEEAQRAEQMVAEPQETDFWDALGGPAGANYVNDINDANGIGDLALFTAPVDPNDPNTWTIPGPYGPEWPLVTEPVEFEVGTTKVRIEIHDENAKYPAGWLLLADEEIRREIDAGFETFCEWMDVNEIDIDEIKEQVKEIAGMRPFKLEFKDISTRTPIEKAVGARSASRRGRRRSRNIRNRPTRYKVTTVSAKEQMLRQAADCSKLFHSSLLDTELLARPTTGSEARRESALKHMGVWGSRKVNVNTAPRQVLEAAFMFGGDAQQIAEDIIQRRRTEPFEDLNDLKQASFGYSDSIRKCEKYITTASEFFTIRVTAVSGVAEASAVIAIHMAPTVQATEAGPAPKTATKAKQKVDIIAAVAG